MFDSNEKYRKLIEARAKSLGINSAMYFPQFDQMFIPTDLSHKFIIKHEELHSYLSQNAYGLIIRSFFELLRTLKDIYIDRFRNIVDEVIIPSKEKDIGLQLIQLDDLFSENNVIVNIFAFYIHTYDKYKILLDNEKVSQEGIVSYLSLYLADLSKEEHLEILKSITKNNFYFESYQKIKQLKEKWSNLFYDILNVIFMVPFYNYNLVGMTIKEFKDVSKYIYNPDKRLDFLINCSYLEEKQIKKILMNKENIVADLKKKKGRENIYHKFPKEFVETAYMLKIHNIMNIPVPDYRRLFEYCYIIDEKRKTEELINCIDEKYKSVLYIEHDNVLNNNCVIDILLQLNVVAKELRDYNYLSSASRDYFLYSRARKNRFLEDKIISILNKDYDKKLLSLNSINELQDVDIFYSTLKRVYEHSRKLNSE